MVSAIYEAMSRASRYTYFATCAPGIEPVLHSEAKALRLAKIERQVGGIRFEGDLSSNPSVPASGSSDTWSGGIDVGSPSIEFYRNHDSSYHDT